MKFIAGIALGAAIALALALGLQSNNVVGNVAVPTQSTIAPMLDRAMPAIVNITTAEYNPRQHSINNSGVGSGVIVDAENGYILTNDHVVEGASDIIVTLIDDRSFKARLVGNDPETDIAVLQIRPDGLTAVPVSNSSEARVGDFVVAIGNPYGLRHTVTMGIVSALGRTGINGGYENLIQTDASINPGNSGGALLNMRGELIGINRAIYSDSGGSVGIGFAIPSNMAMEIQRELQENGFVSRGLLAVQTVDITPRIARVLRLKTGQGAVVARIYRGSPAHQAGMKIGDVIVGVDGKPVQNIADLNLKVGLHDAGETVTLQIIRNNQPVEVNVELGLREQLNVQGSTLHSQLDGATLRSARNVNSPYVPETGVVVLKVVPETPAWALGFRSGDTILGANGKRTADIGELREQLKQSSRPTLLRLRGRSLLEIAIEPVPDGP